MNDTAKNNYMVVRNGMDFLTMDIDVRTGNRSLYFSTEAMAYRFTLENATALATMLVADVVHVDCMNDDEPCRECQKRAGR